METEACNKCGKNFDLADPLATPLELPCEHEVCTNCHLTAEDNEADTGKIRCLICKQQFKFKKGYQVLINSAKKLLEKDLPLVCSKHPDQQFIYICREKRRVMCRKCVFEPVVQDRFEAFKYFRPSETK